MQKPAYPTDYYGLYGTGREWQSTRAAASIRPHLFLSKTKAGADWGWFLSRLNTYLESGNPGWACANCKPEPNRRYQLHQIRAEPMILTVTFCLIATSVTFRIINTEICVFWLKRRELLRLLYV